MRPFCATNLFGIIFARKEFGELGRVTMNHEYIHTLQQRETLFFFFVIFYLLEWLFRLCQYRNAMKAYRNISFEREAYANEMNLEYRHHRRFWAWTRYLWMADSAGQG